MKKLFVAIIFIIIVLGFQSCKQEIANIEILCADKFTFISGKTEKISVLLRPDIINDGMIGKFTVKDNGILIHEENVDKGTSTTIIFDYVCPTITGEETHNLTLEVIEKQTGETTTKEMIIKVFKPDTYITMNVTPSDENLEVSLNQYLYFSYYLNSDFEHEGKLGMFKIKENDNVIYSFDYTSSYNTNTYGYFNFEPNEYFDNDTVITLTFEIQDSYSENITTIEKQITINAGYMGSDTWGDLYFHDYSLSSSMMYYINGSYTSTTSGYSTYGDIAFAYNTEHGKMLCSPDAPIITEIFSIGGVTYSTSDKNHSKIMKYTATDFEDLTYSIIKNINIIEESIISGSIGVDNLVVGDMIAFENEEGIKGVISVDDISSYYIEISCKFQVLYSK